MSILKLPAVLLFLCSVVLGGNSNTPDSMHTCSYFITSEPTNARVFIDDSLYGLTPLKLFNFSKSFFYLRIKSDRDTNWVMAVKVPGKSEVNIHALLEGKYSLLNVHSDPEGAELYVDGVHLGRTPMEEIKISAGLADVKVVKKNYLTKVESFYISPYSHHRHDISVKLKSAFSSLDLSALSDYEKISVDGKPLNPKELKRLEIVSGEHFISAENSLKNKKIAQDISIDGEADYVAVAKLRFQSTPLVVSMLLPGLGQTIDGAYIKGISIMGGFLGIAAAAYITADDYSQKKDLYNLRLNKYVESANESDAMANKALMLQAKSDLDKASGPKNFTLGLLAGVYIGNLIDVLLFHSVKEYADLKKMQQADGLSWQIDKDKMSVGMKFNF